MSDLKFCAKSGCRLPAVGVPRWMPRVGDNPYPVASPMCRPHHLEEIEPQIQVWQVVGPLAVVDVRTGQEIVKPGLVALDPAETAIDQLVYAGLIAEPAEATAKATKKG